MRRRRSGFFDGGSLWLDALHAGRNLARDPGFLLFTTAVIGLGIGASATAFSVMNPLLLQPLPLEEADRLLWIANTGEDGGLGDVTFRTNALRDFRTHSASIDGLTGYNAFFEGSIYTLTGAGEPELLIGVDVAHDFLEVLGVTPVHGRGFDRSEGVWGGPAAVVLTHRFWTKRYGGDPGIVGTAITLNSAPWTVVGVLPPTFDFSSVFAPTTEVDFLLPYPIGDETSRWGNTTAIIGRLRPNISIEVATADLATVVRGLDSDELQRVEVSRLQDQIALPFGPGLRLLGFASALVMLIACANVSNMLLARSQRRAREMALRKSLGAPRGRLVRQLVLESLFFSLSGGLLGLVIALGSVRLIRQTSRLVIPLLDHVAVDGSVLVFGGVAALISGLAIGVVPALRIKDGGEAKALASAGRGSTAGLQGRRLREFLVVSEIAMACVLLLVGGLVLRSFQQVMDVDLGFEPDGLVVWDLSSTRSFEKYSQKVAYFEELMTAVTAAPGVDAAGLSDALPLGRNRSWDAPVVGVQYQGDDPAVFPHVIDHRYLETMGIALLSGRSFEANDRGPTTPVVLINESAARVLFPNDDPLGRFIEIGWGVKREVVGVVRDVRHQGLELDSGSEVYIPYTQILDYRSLQLVVRSTLPMESLVQSVASAMRRTDANLPTGEFQSVTKVVEGSVSPRWLVVLFTTVFASIALLLAGIGIYGVLSYTIAARRPEIRVRMALGATPANIRRGVVRATMVLTLAGIIAGVLVSILGTRLIRSQLFGLGATDPVTYAVMLTVLVSVSLFAAWVPAVRAAREEAAAALRAT